MGFAVIVNASAGAASRLGREKLRALLNDSLGKQLASLRFVRGKALCAACEEAIAASPDALLILGGDGTCRTAAAMAAEKDVPIALLPGGTMNILPKRVWGEAPLEHVLDAIAKGEVDGSHLDMGTANGMPFFVAAAFGLVPTLARVRERWREAKSLRESAGALAAVPPLSQRLFRPTVHVKTGKTDRRAAALVVSVGDADRLLPWGDDGDERLRSFECVTLDVKGWRDLAGLTFRAAVRGDWRDHALVENFQATSLVAQSGKTTPITLDGEPHRMKGAVTLTYRRNAVRVVSPKRKGAANDDPHRASVRPALSR